MKILIVGAGLSGLTIARLAADEGHLITIIDKRNHIGGNIYDYIHPDTGIRLSKYGAHIFHTSDEDVWQFVNRFSQWTDYKHRVLSLVDNSLVPVPVNRNTINKIFNLDLQTEEEAQAFLDTVTYKGEVKNSEHSAKARVGNVLYEKMFKYYTKKQWDKYPSELDPSVMERIPVRVNTDDRYFNDTYEGLPKDGYTALAKNMVEHPNIIIKLSTAYDNSFKGYDKVYFTGKIDTYFNNKFGKLEYRSLVFKYETVDVKDYQPTSVVNYPSLDYGYTRIIDYKKFYPIQSDKSIIAKEYSTDKGEEYYPVPNKANKDLYIKYQEEAERLEKDGIYFVGRLANYKYLNMDQAISNAIAVYKNTRVG